MTRRARPLLLAVSLLTLGLTVGETEVGPVVPLTLVGNTRALFETAVNVTDVRTYEGYWGFRDKRRSLNEIERLLKDARSQLLERARAASADQIVLAAIWDGDGPDLVVTCFFETLDAPGKCLESP